MFAYNSNFMTQKISLSKIEKKLLISSLTENKGRILPVSEEIMQKGDPRPILRDLYQKKLIEFIPNTVILRVTTDSELLREVLEVENDINENEGEIE